MQTSKFDWDQLGSITVYQPKSVSEISELVRNAENQAIYPMGGRQALNIGMPANKAGFAIETRLLNQIVDYPFKDMTITVQAGMAISELQATLAQQNQSLPIDFASPNSSTIGGAIAVNASGPRRFGNGTLRDYLIGISFVVDSGEEVKGGGRVVKNVAGYDLMKLNIGAFGRFGVLTQLTFKVKPVAEQQACVIFETETEHVSKRLDQLHNSASRPIGVELINCEAAKRLNLNISKPWLILCFFEEKNVTVKWQIETVKKEIGSSSQDFSGNDANKLLQKLTDLPCQHNQQYSWKTIVRPSEVADLALKLPQSDIVHAHAMSGIVWSHSSSEQKHHPHSLCRCGPANFKTLERVWGETKSDSALRAKIKAELDPKNLFNPGR